MHQDTYTGSRIFPELHYRDARRGIAFLEQAFGFEPHLIVPGDGETIAHAELKAGSGFVMLGSLNAGDHFKYRSPQDINGANTGGVYTAVPGVDDYYVRAKRAGASIVRQIEDTDYGSRDFSARDPEGFLWHFGTYHPTVDGRSASEPSIFGGMRYRNARAAIAWLTSAFGFDEHFVVAGTGDDVAHAQLRLGTSLLMIGSARDDEFQMKTPSELDGAFTQTHCVFVDDPDRHHAQADSAGAEILEVPADTPYGARGYVVRDPEGYVWTFSTYHPIVNRRVRVESV